MGHRSEGNMKNVLMVGAGSVGGFFGAHLAKQNQDVSFLLRPRTLQAVKERGLTIRSAAGTFTVRPRAAADPRELPKPDLVILSVKAYDLDEVLDQLSPVLSEQTVLLTLQNGVDTEDRILARIHHDCVVGGVAYIYSKIVEPGVIEHYKRGSVAIGELMGHRSERVQAIASVFQQAGIPCQLVEDVRRTKWEKMCWNCVFNPLTVLINDRIAKALDHPQMLEVIRQIVDEVVAVAAACKVPLTGDMSAKVVRWSQEIRDIHTSMYDDWKAGRPTEIDYLNGYIVQRAREWGIPTPLNEALAVMIKVITERDRSGPDILRMEGAVIQPVTLDREAIAKLAEEHQIPDVGVLVPGTSGKGVRIRGLLDVPALAIGADHVVFHSQDGRFSACLTLQQAKDFGVLVYEADGGALSAQKGGPFRLITPGLGDLCANVKSVNRIEVSVGPGKDTRPSTRS